MLFQKGVSGNPGGKPKDSEAKRAKEFALANTARALAVLVELMQESNSPKVRLAAANSLLDRGLGRPGIAPGETGVVEIIAVNRRCASDGGE